MITSNRRRATAVVLAALLGAAALVALAPQAGRSAHRATPNSRQVLHIGRLRHGTIRFALDLRLREQALDSYLRRVEPSTGTHGSLTASKFGARFGQSDAELGRLRGVLGRLGIAIDHVYPQRTAILVHSGVTHVERLFSIHFDRYALPDGQRYFAPDGPPGSRPRSRHTSPDLEICPTTRSPPRTSPAAA